MMLILLVINPSTFCMITENRTVPPRTRTTVTTYCSHPFPTIVFRPIRSIIRKINIWER